MSLRITTEWLWYLLALYAGFWSPARCVTVRAPPQNPSTVEAQAKFFQYRHLPTSDDYDQGHRLGSERHFTERHDRSRPGEGLFSAKVRWGDKKGGYGEHYWDLNHAGHSDNHGDDNYDGDGSYNENSDPYDEPSDHSPTYGNEEYDPEKAGYEEANRNKRAHPNVKTERKVVESYEEPTQHKKRKNREPLEAAASEEEPAQTSTSHEQQRRQHKPDNEKKEKQQFVLVVKHKEEKQASEKEDSPQMSKAVHSVPYESRKAVRQHQEQAASASIPRLFLEPSTGHVVDRLTGQAYMLQPINYN